MAVNEKLVSGLHAYYSQLGKLGFPLSALVELQGRCVRLDKANWTVRQNSSGFSVSFFWEVSAGAKCENDGTSPNSPKSKKKKRRKKKAKQAQAQEAPAVSVLVSAEVGVQTESVPLVQTRPAVTNETAPGGSGDLDTCDSSPEFDLKTCQSVSYEKRDGVPGVQYFDEDGQEGWTPVVKKKRKRKPGAGVKEDSEESSDEELPIRAARQAKYKEKEGIPGLSVRYGNTMHSWKWTPIRTTTPIAYRTRTRIKQ